MTSSKAKLCTSDGSSRNSRLSFLEPCRPLRQTRTRLTLRWLRRETALYRDGATTPLPEEDIIGHLDELHVSEGSMDIEVEAEEQDKDHEGEVEDREIEASAPLAPPHALPFNNHQQNKALLASPKS